MQVVQFPTPFVPRAARRRRRRALALRVALALFALAFVAPALIGLALS